MKEIIAIAILYGIALFFFSKKAIEQLREISAVMLERLGEEE
jgi:hypothetical protein